MTIRYPTATVDQYSGDCMMMILNDSVKKSQVTTPHALSSEKLTQTLLGFPSYHIEVLGLLVNKLPGVSFVMKQK